MSNVYLSRRIIFSGIMTLGKNTMEMARRNARKESITGMTTIDENGQG